MFFKSPFKPSNLIYYLFDFNNYSEQFLHEQVKKYDNKNDLSNKLTQLKTKNIIYAWREEPGM